MATDAATLAALGSIYRGQSPAQWKEMELALLAQILVFLNPMAAVDPISLLQQAQPYACFGPQNWQLMELALLAQILSGELRGPPGPPGTPGNTGPGVAPGGTANQVLAKINSTDFNTHWVNSTGGVDILQVQVFS